MAKPALVYTVRQSFEDYSSAAVTAGTNKREWTALFPGRVVAHARAEGAGSGAGSTVIDVNVNGTSVLESTLSLASASTGEFSGGAPAANASVQPGDRVSYDIDSVPATAGHTRVSVSIAIVAP